MAINKVVYNNNTLVDLTSDNVAQSDVRSGVYFHTKDGVRRQGTSSAIVPSGNINIATTNQVNVTNYATAQVVDSNLVASNIKNGVNILGVDGTYSGGVTPTGSISITENGTYDVTNYASADVSVSGGGGLDRADFASVTVQQGGLVLNCLVTDFPQSQTTFGVGIFIKGTLINGYGFNVFAGTDGGSVFGIIIDQDWRSVHATGVMEDPYIIIYFSDFYVDSVSEAYMYALS